MDKVRDKHEYIQVFRATFCRHSGKIADSTYQKGFQLNTCQSIYSSIDKRDHSGTNQNPHTHRASVRPY